MPIEPQCAITEDTLLVIDEHLEPEIRVAELADGTSGYQMSRLADAGSLIRKQVELRARGKRISGENSWREIVDAQLDISDSDALDPDEERARSEKAAGLEEIFRSRVSIVVGPAGTGKTTLLRALCMVPEVRNGGVTLLAPTGKARVRLEQQTGIPGGKTIAQFLRPLDRYDAETGRYLVTGSSKRSSESKTVVIDEASMMTEEQLAAVLDGLSGVERLILVGDARQLPPIGSGRPFLDIIAFLQPDDIEARFPRVAPCFVELTVQRRQIGQGRDDLLLAEWFAGGVPSPEADEIWDALESTGRTQHVEVIQWKSAAELQGLLIERLVSELGLEGPEDENGFEASLGGSPYGSAVYFNAASPKYGSDGAGKGAERWQILSPVRAHEHGVDSINRRIQQQFRKRVQDWAQSRQITRGDGLEGRTRRLTAKPFGRQGILYGDKVINLNNGSRKDVYPKGEADYLANGEIGIVVGQYRSKKWPFDGPPWKLEVEFSTQPGFKYGFSAREFSEDGEDPLELAYALTIHKSQGSEFSISFVIIPDPCRLLSRELLYTALTRHQEKVLILLQGEPRSLRQYSAAEHSVIANRMTNLFQAPQPVEVHGRLFEENLIHRTRRGEQVRSKSEVIIANLLHALDIDYEYERELRGKDNTVRYPDFTIDSVELGLTTYVEHLGMLSDPSYEQAWRRKKDWYEQNGITEEGGENGLLIVTRDSDDGGIDSEAIEHRVREALSL